jgi:uncharacterized protein (TIGR02058 family)
MALVRCVTEMGMGVDVHGLDDTLAAKRAVFDAIHHSSLGFARLVGATADEMLVHVLIGVPHPDKVQIEEVANALPHGRATVQVVVGGLELLNADGSDGRSSPTPSSLSVWTTANRGRRMPRPPASPIKNPRGKANQWH